jgi:hypothetical protein
MTVSLPWFKMPPSVPRLLIILEPLRCQNLLNRSCESGDAPGAVSLC